MSSPHQQQRVAAPRHLQPHLLLRPGQAVHVNHGASWLNATVTSVGSRAVGVRYRTTAAAVSLADAVLPWAVRPADGARLRAARQITAGDQIIFGTRTRTVAALPVEGRDGWLTLTFTDGGQAALVMPGAVLRLVDDTSQVTVNGQPLAAMVTSMGGTAVAEPTIREQFPLRHAVVREDSGLSMNDMAGQGQRDPRVVVTCERATTLHRRGL